MPMESNLFSDSPVFELGEEEGASVVLIVVVGSRVECAVEGPKAVVVPASTDMDKV